MTRTCKKSLTHESRVNLAINYREGPANMVSAKNARSRKIAYYNDLGARIGETHWRAKLTDADVEQVHALRDMGLSYKAIADKFDDVPGGIGKSTVRDIIKLRIRAQTATTRRRCG
jgi:hypothetical protein